MDQVKLGENVRKLLVLDAIRQSGNNVPCPLDERWDALGDEIGILLREGLLSNDSGVCQITDNGKKTLLLFEDERNNILKGLEVYREVMIGDRIIDGRIPVEAFKLRKSSNLERAAEHLFSIAALIIWKEFFQMIKKIHDNANWQQHLFNSFYFNAMKRARLDAWMLLGRTQNEALITGVKLTTPIVQKDLIPITKN